MAKAIQPHADGGEAAVRVSHVGVEYLVIAPGWLARRLDGRATWRVYRCVSQTGSVWPVSVWAASRPSDGSPIEEATFDDCVAAVNELTAAVKTRPSNGGPR